MKIEITESGAKSPLAIGSETGYLMETCHNGKRFLIRIFDFNYHSMIGQWDIKGKENPHVLFYEGTEDEIKIYYEPTDSFNFTEITIEVSPTQRSIFSKAVHEQLQYFDNIAFVIIDENGQWKDQKVAVEKLYEGRTFIIPAHSNYVNPHLILNKVNYGLVNYGAMELNQRKGCLALKIDPSRVEVDRSRESLIYNQLTREEIIKFHKEVEEEAIEVLLSSFNIDNYAEWIESVLGYVNSKYDSKSNNVPGILSSFLEGYALDLASLIHTPTNLMFQDLFAYSAQWVQTNTFSPRLPKGSETKVLEELGVSLQYSSSEDFYSRSKILAGTPIVIRYIKDVFNIPSISAGEKFSILKYLRDKEKNHNINSYYIVTLMATQENHVMFLKSIGSAKLKYLKLFNFDKASTAYKINIDNGEVVLTSEQERLQKEREERKKEEAKYKRDNKIFTYYQLKPFKNNFKNSSSGFINFNKYTGNAQSLVNEANGNLLIYGQAIERRNDPTKKDHDDLQYGQLLTDILNRKNSISIFMASKSSMNYFPTEGNLWIRNYFNRINPVTKKLQLGDISEFLQVLAYSKEITDFYKWFKKLNVHTWSDTIFNKWVEVKNMYNDQINNLLEDLSSGDVYPRYFADSVTSALHDYEYQKDFSTFLVNIAKFGRFCHENSTASEDFLANAFISITELPEDTDINIVPVGVEGFNSSPLQALKEIENILSPIQPLFKSIEGQTLTGSLKPVFIEAFKNFKFTTHNL